MCQVCSGYVPDHCGDGHGLDAGLLRWGSVGYDTGGELYTGQNGAQTGLTFGGSAAFADLIARSDARWGDLAGFGNPGGNVTFSFSDYRGGGAMQFTEEGRDLVVASLRMIADVANITFSWEDEGPYDENDPQFDQIDSSTGDIVYTQYGTSPYGGGVGGWSGSRFSGEPTWRIDEGYVDVTGQNLSLFLHETMHALGLSHPGNYNGSGASYANDAPHWDDTEQFTLMSYWSSGYTGGNYQGNAHTGLMLYDIAALQLVYGANMTTRTGDTVYGFNSNVTIEGDLGETGAIDEYWNLENANDDIIAAVWDAGGIDTLDLSGFSSDSDVDLREEAFSSFGGLTNNFAIAAGVTIENAIGGAGNDTLRGNDAANVLTGGAGADDLIGGGGSDTVSYANAAAGVTASLLAGGTAGDASGDTFDSIESLTGSAFTDALLGSNGANVLSGGGGNDFLVGRDGNDTLVGGAGGDRLDGGAGADVLDGGADFDIAYYKNATSAVALNLATGGTFGEAAGDTYSSVEQAVGTFFADTLSGDSGRNGLSGGAGDDTLIGNGGDDVLFGSSGDDTFVFAAGHGRDRIIDFTSGEDTLDYSLHAGVGSFADLTVFASGANAIVQDGQGGQVVLQGAAGTVDASDFAF